MDKKPQDPVFDKVDIQVEDRFTEFQQAVYKWMTDCVGRERTLGVEHRSFRFLEEALELVQACGVTRSQTEELCNYVFSRPAGDRKQELGGTMVTLHGLATALELSAIYAGEVELRRCWENINKIRQKDLSKPMQGSLPGTDSVVPPQHGFTGGGSYP